MLRVKSFAATLLLGAALLTSLLASGCAARVRYYDGYYDGYYADYHPWNDGEVRAYHIWLGERHYEYREFHRLNRDQQRDYRRWRHEHPDR